MEDPKIIYEDENILVLNKPAGLSVHPAHLAVSPPSGGEIVLTDWLVENYPEIKKVGDEPELRPGIVHRLDKDTSGVLAVAKNQKTFEFLKKQFKDRTVKKTYLTLVYGKLEPSDGGRTGIIDLPLGKSRKDFRKRAGVGATRGELREAITEYKVKSYIKHSVSNMDYTLLEVYPKTGRTHQIRAHFKAIGYPIVGDSLYSPKKVTVLAGLKRQFLHASSLELSLPDGSKIRLEAELPNDLQNVLGVLK